jgi:hypothetical protein
VSNVVGNKKAFASTSTGSLLRGVGRVALWAAVALLMVRGGGAIIAGPSSSHKVSTDGSGAVDPASAAFAIRFARTYLDDPSTQALAPFLAEGVSLPSGRPPREAGAEVVQAELSKSDELGDGEEVLTVACELRDSRTLYLAVPIARSRAGEVAALGAPSIVAAPGTAAGADADRSQPLAGGQASAIDSLVSKFLPTYLASTQAEDLSYLLAPGALIQPLGGAVVPKAVGEVNQLGNGEGPRRTVLASVRVSDPVDGGTYPLVYRLEVERRGADGRWYVSALEGVSA